LFVGLIAKTYAPELRLVGVAVAAPATDLKTLLSDDITTAGGRNLTAMTLYSWSRVFNAPIDALVEPSALAAMNRLSNECIENIFDILERRITERPLKKAFLTDDSFAQQTPWKELLAENTPGPLPADIPVFIAQGTADGLVLPTVTQNYVALLCRSHVAVQTDWLDGVTHAYVAKKSAIAAIGWIADRFSGLPPPTVCLQ